MSESTDGEERDCVARFYRGLRRLDEILTGRFLCTPEISGEFRVAVMLSRAGSAVGIRPSANRCGDLTRNRLEEIVDCSLITSALNSNQEHKKSANLHQAAELRGDFLRSEDRSSAHRPFWSRHLAVSNGRLPDSVSRITPDA
jgi:hypothetical protein